LEAQVMTRVNSAASSQGREAAALLAWYDRHRRRLPWRAEPGELADPYRVWLSEIMLQQTTAAAVAPYFRAFVARWPNVEALAAASLDEVLGAWAGLGYYARARNLHACAQPLPRSRRPVSRQRGGFAGAARHRPLHGRRHRGHRLRPPAAAVDGNAERVIARLDAIEANLPQAKPEIHARVLDMVPADRPGDFAQALMDLGATICTPRQPACALCPWAGDCEAHRRGIARELPRKARSASARRGTAPPSGSSAPTVRCSCAGGPTRGCSAA
jgi:A/G-specific adenine glycosylase